MVGFQKLLILLLLTLNNVTIAAAKTPLKLLSNVKNQKFAQKKHGINVMRKNDKNNNNDVDNNNTNINLDKSLLVRGGACSDSNPILFVKIVIASMFETAALTGTIFLGNQASKKINLPKVLGISIPELLSIFAVIFASSFFGSFIDGGLSAATSQLLDPNVTPGDPEWYSKLLKPSWNPPGWLFPIMWLIVSKPTQLLAVSRMLRIDPIPWNVLVLYCTHLSLGDAWNKVFFGLQCTGRGAAVITLFYAVLLSTAFVFYQLDPLGGKFMLPTCGWVTVATALNWSIYLKNK